MMVLRLFLSSCGPFRELQPASLLTMREHITIVRFQGHCQQWSEPRARIDAGVLSRMSTALRGATFSPMLAAQPVEIHQHHGA
jgi:hypothetical protein